MNEIEMQAAAEFILPKFMKLCEWQSKSADLQALVIAMIIMGVYSDNDKELDSEELSIMRQSVIDSGAFPITDIHDAKMAIIKAFEAYEAASC